MSLVNKMLRDLDARHIGANERAALPAAVTPLAARHERKLRPAVLVGGLLAVMALAGALAWQESRSDVAPIQPMPARQATSLPIAPAPAAVAGPVTIPAAVPASAPNPTPAPVVSGLPAAGAANAPLPNADAAPSASALRMAAELSVVPSSLNSEAKPAARGEPRAAAAKPVVATATEKRPAAEKLIPDKPAKAPAATAVAMKPAQAEPRIDKQERVPTAAERAEAEYRRAASAQRQGNQELALGGYRSALEHSPEHAGARQALAAQLIEARRYDEADEVLRKGIDFPSTRLSSTLALARLKVERNQVAAALELLQKNANVGEASAEFQGFTGALLNRAGRSAEAVERYRHAARLAPGEGRWWAGLGISLDASGKPSEAREAYLRARQSPDLPSDLALHVDQRLH